MNVQQENLSLNWHTYPDHLRDMMKELFELSEFSDVTLICEDKKQIKAHKNILGASSSCFRDIFKSDKSSNQIIYLRGIKHSEMEPIMQFVYLGEATIHENRTKEFLSVARSLEIEELDQSEYLSEDDKVKYPSYNEKLENNSASEPSIMKCKCKVNLGGQRFACWNCDKDFSSKYDLKRHVEVDHEGKRYSCNQCDYQAKENSKLLRHIKAMHDGVEFKCHLCDFKTGWKTYLTKHIKSKHSLIDFDMMPDKTKMKM